MRNSNPSEISVRRAVLYTAIAKYSDVMIHLLFVMILSRILTPREFGIVAVVSVFISFFSLISGMGLGPGVIQNKKLSAEDVNHIFSVSVYGSFILMLLFICLSYPISVLYEDTVYLKLCPLLSFVILFNSLNMIPSAVMLRDKRFKSIGLRTVICSVFSSIVTIMMALLGWGVFALCLNQVISSFLIFLWNVYSVKLSMIFKPSINPIKMIWSYSIYQQVSMTINFFSRNLDNLLIGKFFPKADLAYYNKSYTLMMMPIVYIPGVVNPVLHPILSEYQNDWVIIYEKYTKLLRFLLVIGCIVGAFCYTFGEEIILLFFGLQWERAILPFRLLSISLFGQLLTNTVGSVYQSLGNTKGLFNLVILSTTLIILFIIIGVLLGNINTIALMVSAAYLANFFLMFYMLISKTFGNSYFGFISKYIADLLLYIIYIGITKVLIIMEAGFLYRLAFFTLFVLCYLFAMKRVRYICEEINRLKG